MRQSVAWSAILGWLFGATVSFASRDSSPKMKNILVLGDSLSEGFRLQPSQAWPALLAERLRKIDPGFQIRNASVNGSTTDGGLRRLPQYLQRPVSIFILELGINDAFSNNATADLSTTLRRSDCSSYRCVGDKSTATFLPARDLLKSSDIVIRIFW